MTPQQKVNILQKSGLTDMLVSMGGKCTYTHVSTDNKTRYPNMGCVVKLSNLVLKVKEADDLDKQDNADQVFTQAWNDFVGGELESSNKNDKVTLGGANRLGDSEEDEPA